MSKGNQVVTVRISDKQMQDILDACKSRNDRTADEPSTFSDFIRVAVQDKLNHYSRARKQLRGKRYQCAQCGDVVGIKDVAYEVRPLFGPTEITCVMCERVRTAD